MAIGRNLRAADAAADAGLRWLLAATTAIVVSVLVLSVHVSAQVRQIHEERSVVVTAGHELLRERMALDLQIAILERPERIETIARERLGLVRSDAGRRVTLPQGGPVP